MCVNHHRSISGVTPLSTSCSIVGSSRPSASLLRRSWRSLEFLSPGRTVGTGAILALWSTYAHYFDLPSFPDQAWKLEMELSTSQGKGRSEPVEDDLVQEWEVVNVSVRLGSLHGGEDP